MQEHLGIDVDKLDEHGASMSNQSKSYSNHEDNKSHSDVLSSNDGEGTPVPKVWTDSIPEEVIVEAVKEGVVKGSCDCEVFVSCLADMPSISTSNDCRRLKWACDSTYRDGTQARFFSKCKETRSFQ